MHALPLIGTGGGEGSLTWAFFRAAEGDVGAIARLLFFVLVLRLASGEAGVTFFLRIFLVEVLGISIVMLNFNVIFFAALSFALFDTIPCLYFWLLRGECSLHS
jgi:hypothetical protein